MPVTPWTASRASTAGEALPHIELAALDALLPLLAAILLGALAAKALRRRHLHWSWAPVAALVALALAPVFGAAAQLAALAAAWATVRARRRHRNEIDAGADLGLAARGRVTPIAAARRLTARVAEDTAFGRRAIEMLARRADPGTLLLGRDPAGRAVRVPFSPGHAAHTLIVGATGSGKTVTQTLLAEQAIAEGRAVVVVDPKGDRAMRTRLAAAAARGGRRFLEWTPAGPCSYNPYARGGETEIADRLLAGERFTEPHYLRQAQRYLGHAIRALRSCGRDVHLGAIVEMLDPSALEVLLRGADPELAAQGHAYMDSLTERQQRDLAGVRDRLAILAESEVGDWLGAAASFDLLEACRAGSVVLFELEADSRPLLAQMIGAAIVQDLQSTVAALQGAPAPTLVVIDEFSALGARQVTALFGRARSAGVSLVLGTQELADLRLPGSERLLEQVLGNVSLLLAHRQVVPDSAELVSRLAGTRGCWRVSWGSGRRTTRTRASEPVLDPELLMELSPGVAVAIGFGAGREASLVRVGRAGGER
jgi:hypothetical protein